MRWRIRPLMVGAAIALGVNLAFLALIFANLRSGGSTEIGKVDWKSDLSAPVDNAISRQSVEAYRQILARPVFFRSREPFVRAQPPPPATRTVPSNSVADPNLVLGGVMIEGNVRKAYLFIRNNPSGAWVSEGEEFMGWQLRSIDSASAKLEQKDRRIDLQLYPND